MPRRHAARCLPSARRAEGRGRRVRPCNPTRPCGGSRGQLGEGHLREASQPEKVHELVGPQVLPAFGRPGRGEGEQRGTTSGAPGHSRATLKVDRSTAGRRTGSPAGRYGRDRAGPGAPAGDRSRRGAPCRPGRRPAWLRSDRTSNSVVLPAPFGPTGPMMAPCSARTDTPSTARLPPKETTMPAMASGRRRRVARPRPLSLASGGSPPGGAGPGSARSRDSTVPPTRARTAASRRRNASDASPPGTASSTNSSPGPDTISASVPGLMAGRIGAKGVPGFLPPTAPRMAPVTVVTPPRITIATRARDSSGANVAGVGKCTSSPP